MTMRGRTRRRKVIGEGEETIGKSSGINLRNANGSVSSTSNNSISPGGPGGGDYKSTATTSPSPSTRRIRAQSAYGYANLLPPQASTMRTTAPLKPKLRSRSAELPLVPLTLGMGGRETE